MTNTDETIKAFYVAEKVDDGVAAYLRGRGWQVVPYRDAGFFRSVVGTSLLEDQLAEVVLLDGAFRGKADEVLWTLQRRYESAGRDCWVVPVADERILNMQLAQGIMEGVFGERIKVAQALMGEKRPRELILEPERIEALEGEIRQVRSGIEAGAGDAMRRR